MDRFSPVAPAQIHVLVLPVGDIDRSKFTGFVRTLQHEGSIVSLSDAASLTSTNGPLFSLKQSDHGALLFNYSTTMPSEWQQSLSPFELFREPLLVLGVMDGSTRDGQDETKEMEAATQYLRERHPRVIHRQLILLDGPEMTGHTSKSGLLHIKTTVEDSERILPTTMRQLSARFLEELSTYAVAMQVSPSIQTPGQVARRPRRTISLRTSERRPHSSSNAGSSNTTPTTPTDDNAPRFPLDHIASSPPPSADHVLGQSGADSTRPSSDSHNSDSNGRRTRPASRDHGSMHAFGSGTSQEKLRLRGKSRVGIVTGTLHMMAGQWSQALTILAEHTTKARALSDSIWHAKGQENIVACILLHMWKSIDFQIPHVLTQLGDKFSVPQQRFSMNIPADFRSLNGDFKDLYTRFSHQIPDLLRSIINTYRLGEGGLELPSVVISEATVRLCKLLAFLYRRGGKLDQDTITHMISGTAPGESMFPLANGIQAQNPISKALVADLLSHSQLLDFEDLPLGDSIVILGGSATIYGLLNMNRKKAMVIRDVVLKLTTGLVQARKRGAAELGIHPATSFSTDTGSTALLDLARDNAGVRSMVREIARVYGITLADSMSTKFEISDAHSGSDSLKMKVAGDLIAFCEASPDPEGVLQLAVSMLRISGPVGAIDPRFGSEAPQISLDEQSRLTATITKAINVSKFLDRQSTGALFWDPYVVRGVRFVEADEIHTFVGWPLKPRFSVQNDEHSKNNPLIYDRKHGKSPSEAAKLVSNVVQGEPFDCIVTLQNPTDTTFDIEHLDLVTEGVDLQTNHGVLTLGPRRMQEVHLVGTASFSGKCKIVGCRMKMSNCAEHVFPIIQKPWNRSAPAMTKPISHHKGKSNDDTTKRPVTLAPDHETVSVLVLPPQPLLDLRHTSLNESCLTMIEGELRTLTMTLQNKSLITAKIFDISSSDSSLRITQPSYDADQGLEIYPGQILDFEFEVWAKPEIGQPSITFYYGRTDGIAELARTIRVPLAITVDVSMRAQNMDVQPANAEHGISNSDTLFSVDVGNARPETMSYECVLMEDSSVCTRSSNEAGTIGPGEVHRIQLRLPRDIVAASIDDTPDTVRRALIDRLHISWKLRDRLGRMDLTNLRLTSQALDLLRGYPVCVTTSLLDGTQTQLKAGSFTAIRVRVKVVSPNSKPLSLIVKLQARTAYTEDAPCDERSVVITGAPYRMLPLVSQEEDATVDFTACVLLRGTIEFVATVRPTQLGEIGAPAWQASDSVVVKVS